MKVSYAPAGAQTIDTQNLIGRTAEFSCDGKSFEQSFNDSRRGQYEETVSVLAEKIEKQGALLAKKIDIGEMERYRALVSELLKEVISNAYSFRRENAFDQKGRHKVYATVMKINEKLEEIARNILSDNQNTLEIISNIDDIRGLIVDVFL